MWWTLLIWMVIGFVAHVVWYIGTLVRAVRNGWNMDLYQDVFNRVLEEGLIEDKERYRPVVRIFLIVFYNFLWPWKIVWMSKDLLSKADDLYVDLVLEELEKGECA